MRRPGRLLIVGAAIVVVAGLALTGVTLTRLTGSATPSTAAGPPRFVEETASAGVGQVYDGPVTPFSVGGGVAVFDCNGDGRPDLYVAGGSHPAGLFRNDSSPGGALRFSRLAAPATDLSDVIGAYPIDIDGDGVVDLAVLRVGQSVLLRGLGGCRFSQANALWSFADARAFTSAFSATWEGASRLPTLALGRYLKLDSTGQPTYDCADNALFRPQPDGLAYAAPLVLSPGYCTLSVLFSDWDRSGRRDLRLTDDRHYYGNDGEDQLWRVAPGQPPRLYTASDGWVAMQIWGMGIASYDVNGDGYPEVYLTSQGDNKLQTLTAGPAQPTYRDIALKRGVTAARPFTGGDVLPSTAWHPEFQDVNNDGFVDLFVSKGNVSSQPDYAQRDPSDLLLGQPDGTFREAGGAAGVLNYERGRGAALADFNLDGMLDLVELNYGGPIRLWRNVGSGDAAHPGAIGNWLALRVSEPGPNHDAIGAWLELQVGGLTERRELTIGGGHAGGQLGWIHFGLGPAANARLRVQWPDGQVGPWLDVAANQFLDVERAASEARPWRPPTS